MCLTEVTCFHLNDAIFRLLNLKKFNLQEKIKYFFIILYNGQQMHNYFTNYHTATCFDTIVSSSGGL
jgi:hypothetical protein